MRTIAHISDLHFGRAEPTVTAALRSDLLRNPPSLLVISGDMTQRARAWQFIEAADFLKSLPTPQLVIPGNHDIPAYNLFKRFYRPLRLYKQHISNDLTPFYEDEELAVVGINTARSLTRMDGDVSVEQLNGVTHRLSAIKDKFKVVVTHHPLLPAPDERRTDLCKNAGRALAAFEQCGVDLLLSGHFHLSYHGDIRTHHTTVRRSMLSVHSGTSTSTRLRDNEPNNYNRITLQKDQVSIAAYAWQEGTWGEKTTTHYSRINDEWVRE